MSDKEKASVIRCEVSAGLPRAISMNRLLTPTMPAVRFVGREAAYFGDFDVPGAGAL